MSDDTRNIIIGSVIVLVSFMAQYCIFVISKYLFGG